LNSKTSFEALEMRLETLEMIFETLKTGFEAGLKRVRPWVSGVLEVSGMDLCEDQKKIKHRVCQKEMEKI
jgi:hypothetical protein